MTASSTADGAADSDGADLTEPLVLELFLGGRSRRGVETERLLRRIIAERGGDGSQLEVIDVFDAPERAEAAGVLATPTLIRRSPGPPVRVIGGLDDARLFLALLDLPDEPPDDEERP